MKTDKMIVEEIVRFVASREKVIKEQNYPKAMAYDDLKLTIQRLTNKT